MTTSQGMHHKRDRRPLFLCDIAYTDPPFLAMGLKWIRRDTHIRLRWYACHLFLWPIVRTAYERLKPWVNTLRVTLQSIVRLWETRPPIRRRNGKKLSNRLTMTALKLIAEGNKTYLHWQTNRAPSIGRFVGTVRRRRLYGTSPCVVVFKTPRETRVISDFRGGVGPVMVYRT